MANPFQKLELRERERDLEQQNCLKFCGPAGFFWRGHTSDGSGNDLQLAPGREGGWEIGPRQGQWEMRSVVSSLENSSSGPRVTTVMIAPSRQRPPTQSALTRIDHSSVFPEVAYISPGHFFSSCCTDKEHYIILILIVILGVSSLLVIYCRQFWLFCPNTFLETVSSSRF